jgi:hypothetical protein
MKSIFELLFDKVLNKDGHVQGHMSSLGLATYKINDQEFLDLLKKKIGCEVIEMEISFFRNRFLHYKPSPETLKRSSAIFLIRVDSELYMIQLKPEVEVTGNTVLHCPIGYTSSHSYVRIRNAFLSKQEMDKPDFDSVKGTEAFADILCTHYRSEKAARENHRHIMASALKHNDNMSKE